MAIADVSVVDERDLYFRTEHLQADLRARSVRGAKATLAAQIFKFAIQAGGMVALARLLTPADFGLVGMVTAITGFVVLFQDMGLSLPTIQKAEITHREVSNLFWMNVAVATGLGLLLAAAAPAAARFYGRPEVVPLMLASAALFPLGGLRIQHSALMMRQMRQGAIATIEIVSIGIGTAVGCGLALLGHGPWALILMQMVALVVSLVLFWGATRWLPARPSRGTGLRVHLASGSRLMLHTALSYAARNVDKLLVGRFWGATALGIYSRGYQILLLPLSQVLSPLFNTVVPTLSRLQKDDSGYREFGLRALNGLLWITLPPLAMLAVPAPEVFALVLGEPWRPAAVIFQWLAASALIQPIQQMYVWTFWSRNETGALLRYTAIVTVVSIAGIVAGMPFGIRTVAIAFAAASIAIVFPLTVGGFARALRAKPSDILRSFIGPGLIAAGICGGGLAGRILASEGGDLRRGIAAFAGSLIIAAVGAASISTVRREIQSFIRLVRRREGG